MSDLLRQLLGRLDRPARALCRALAVIACVVVIVFLLMRLAPGDPVATLLGEGGTEKAVATMRTSLGLDLPVVAQLARYIGNILRGDFGMSLTYQRPAINLVLEALPATILLSLVSFAITVVVAVPTGVAAALLKGSRTETMINGIVLLLQTVPPFWAGIMLIHVFSLRLQLLPTSGTGTWLHLVLPAVTLSLFQIALTVRTLRSAMLEVLKEDFIRTARAKGLSRWRIVVFHGLANAMAPVVTVMALQLGTIFSGAVITEAVFAWPGVGSLALGALLSRDYTLAQAVVVFTSMLVVLLNMLADMLIGLIDPRVRSLAGSLRLAPR